MVTRAPLPPEVERFNTASHLVGAVLAVAALITLVARATGQPDRAKLASVAVYGASLVALYSASSAYHAAAGRLKATLRRLDHLGITLLIAGTYTPFAVVSLRGTRGEWLLAAIWALAAIGCVLEFVPRAHGWSVGLYLLMGWLALSVLGPLSRALAGFGIAWVLLGGAFYTIGAVFYVLDRRWPAAHGVFHVLVLAGSAAHFVAVWVYVA
jgi:hemolysin III